jgi:peptidoglycan/xylan/chitin deacetylase (PgdA/CDA1 family)
MKPLWFEKLTGTVLENEGLPVHAAALAHRAWLATRLAGDRVSQRLWSSRRTSSNGSTHPLRIFMFHAVVPSSLEVGHYCFLQKDLFVRQLELIDRYFEVIPLSTAVEKLQAGALSSPTAVITFDDGFYNNFSLAFPELRRRSIPAAVFVSTGFTGTDQTPWFCRVLQAVTETSMQHVEWDGTRRYLGSRIERERAARWLMAKLKPLPQDELETGVATLENALGLESDRCVGEQSPFRMLDSQLIRDMAETGLIEFGGHSRDHAILSRLDAERQEEQINSSVEAISRILGRPCTLFAYPNGTAEDYDGHSMDCLRRAGVQVSLTTRPGGNGPGVNPLELRRDAVGPPDRGRFFENRIRWMIEHDRCCG